MRAITQTPVDAQVIDKGVPTAGVLAQVLVAKYADHLPLYRQEGTRLPTHRASRIEELLPHRWQAANS